MSPKHLEMKRIEIIPVGGIPEIRFGDGLAKLFVLAAAEQGDPLLAGDVLVVAQKVVSKAEGRTVRLADIVPSARAEEFAGASSKDARLIELILRESRAVVKEDRARGILITETAHGFVCANAGIDASNVPGEGTVLLLPQDPDGSARTLRNEVQALTGLDRVGVVVADTFGRPWREGHTNVAIGVAGLAPMVDYRGTRDTAGKVLRVTEVAVADEIAGAAELVMGKASGVPLAIVRGLPTQLIGEPGRGARALVRDPADDLFR